MIGPLALSTLRMMKKLLALGMVAVGLASGAIAPQQPPDERMLKLQAFFQSYKCPAPYHVEDYLKEADKNAIDYRLLPAISVRESTCGRHARLNNHWGWDSARSGFSSVKAGIRYLARTLSLGPRYKDKPVNAKLETYNPNLQYVAEVMRLMGEISE
jgi:hypothetical protein